MAWESEDDIYITQNKFGKQNKANSTYLILEYPRYLTLKYQIYLMLVGIYLIEVWCLDRVYIMHLAILKTCLFFFKRKQKRIRPIVAVDDAEVKKRQESRVPANTRKQTMWCLAVWEDWIKARRSMPGLIEEFPIIERDITEMDVEEINFWHSKFVLEVRKLMVIAFIRVLCIIFAVDYSAICVIMVAQG